jgi:hypothetical protein
MNTLRLLLVFVMSVLSYSSIAQDGYFELDASVRLPQTLQVRSVRILSNEYSKNNTPWYYMGPGKAITLYDPLISQLQRVVKPNIAGWGDDGLSVVINDFKFYNTDGSGEVMSLYMNIEFFTGEPGALHHIYTVDSLVQGYSRLFKPAGGKFVAECVLQGMSAACKRITMADKEALSDEEALSYRHDKQMVYPLYKQKGFPELALFRTVDDFINLKPVDTPLLFEHIAQLEGDGYNWFYYKTPEGKKGKRIDPEDFYAGCDGKQFYVSFGDSYRRIVKHKDDYYLSITRKMLKSKEGGAGLGVAGYLLAAAVVESITEEESAKKGRQSIVGKFSAQRKAFLPYGGRMPRKD